MPGSQIRIESRIARHGAELAAHREPWDLSPEKPESFFWVMELMFKSPTDLRPISRMSPVAAGHLNRISAECLKARAPWSSPRKAAPHAWSLLFGAHGRLLPADRGSLEEFLDRQLVLGQWSICRQRFEKTTSRQTRLEENGLSDMSNPDCLAKVLECLGAVSATGPRPLPDRPTPIHLAARELVIESLRAAALPFRPGFWEAYLFVRDQLIILGQSHAMFGISPLTKPYADRGAVYPFHDPAFPDNLVLRLKRMLEQDHTCS
jgi:hypothetical protein